MEDKKATPNGRVGIRLFNGRSRAQVHVEVDTNAAMLRAAFFSSTFWVFCRPASSPRRRCIERPNSNPTIRSGFFFFHRGPVRKEPKDIPLWQTQIPLWTWHAWVFRKGRIPTKQKKTASFLFRQRSHERRCHVASGIEAN